MGNNSSTAMSTSKEVFPITLLRAGLTVRKASATNLPAEVLSIVIRCLIGDGPVISNDPSYESQYVTIRSLLLASKITRQETLLHLQDKQWSFVITDFPTQRRTDRVKDESRSIFREKLAAFPPYVWHHLAIRFDLSAATKANALSAERQVQHSSWWATQTYKHAREAAREGSVVIAKHSEALANLVWSILLRQQRLRSTIQEEPHSGMSWSLLGVHEFRQAKLPLPKFPVNIKLLFDSEDLGQAKLGIPLWLFHMAHEILQPWRLWTVESNVVSKIALPSRMASAAVLSKGFKYFRNDSPSELAKRYREFFCGVWVMSGQQWNNYLPLVYIWPAHEIREDYDSIPWYYDAKFANHEPTTWTAGVKKVFIISTAEGDVSDGFGGLWTGEFVTSGDVY
jgi:hypothetical protein